MMGWLAGVGEGGAEAAEGEGEGEGEGQKWTAWLDGMEQKGG